MPYYKPAKRSYVKLTGYPNRRRASSMVVVKRRNRVPVANRAGPELKYVDIASASYACDTTGTVTALNLTAVGDDNTTRDGRQICNRSVHVQGLIRPETAGASTVNLSRLMLVWDSQPNGAIATITDILVASTSVSATNLDNRERFTILRDKRYSQGAQSTTASQSYSDGNNTYAVSEYVNLKDVKTTYNNTTAVIAAVTTGALLMVTIGSAATGGAFVGTTRVRFTDR